MLSSLLAEVDASSDGELESVSVSASTLELEIECIVFDNR